MILIRNYIWLITKQTKKPTRKQTNKEPKPNPTATQYSSELFSGALCVSASDMLSQDLVVLP